VGGAPPTGAGAGRDDSRAGRRGRAAGGAASSRAEASQVLKEGEPLQRR